MILELLKHPYSQRCTKVCDVIVCLSKKHTPHDKYDSATLIKNDLNVKNVSVRVDESRELITVVMP